MEEQILKYLNKLQDIPNVPFLTTPIKTYLINFFKKLNLDYVSNDYSLIVNTIKRPHKKRLIIMAHTDHPGIIVKNKHRGILMGSLETDRLKILLQRKSIDIRIYNPDGTYLGPGKIIKIFRNTRDISLEINFNVELNSFAQFDIDYFNESKEMISAYSLDDSIWIAMMLHLMELKLYSNYDVYFVFNLHEEVHQISAWYLAKGNILNLKRDDIVINLEALKVNNIDHCKYTNTTYSNGPILQLSNTGCLFGYNLSGKNYAETLIRSAAKETNINIQDGIIMDSDDSRPFSYFPITPNIATLTIPNRFKHNCNDSGEIVPESILRKDILSSFNIIKSVIQSKTDLINLRSLSEVLKENDKITNKTLMEKKALLNTRLETYYKDVVKRGYFYPTNLEDSIKDFRNKLIFYSLYFIQKFSR